MERGEHEEVREGRTPRHAGGAARLIVSPGGGVTFDGARPRTAAVVRYGRLDGGLERLFRGPSLRRATETAVTAALTRDVDAVWVADRARLAACWSTVTVATAESRLVATARRADAEFVAWRGPSP